MNVSSGQAIQTVPGFKTMEQCRASGNLWLKELRIKEYSDYRTVSMVASAICMELK